MREDAGGKERRREAGATTTEASGMQAGWGGPKDATEERTQQEGRAATLAAGGMREDSRGAVRGFAGGRGRHCGRPWAALRLASLGCV
jgi:hypothetical protein